VLRLRGALFLPTTVPPSGLRPIITIYGGMVKGRAPEDRYRLYVLYRDNQGGFTKGERTSSLLYL
jgi:hypothetical protein